jgi:hypothetical protein
MGGSERQNHASPAVLGSSFRAPLVSSTDAPSPARVTLPADLSGSLKYLDDAQLQMLLEAVTVEINRRNQAAGSPETWLWCDLTRKVRKRLSAGAKGVRTVGPPRANSLDFRGGEGPSGRSERSKQAIRSYGGPAVRIPFAPAGSLVRTGLPPIQAARERCMEEEGLERS